MRQVISLPQIFDKWVHGKRRRRTKPKDSNESGANGMSSLKFNSSRWILSTALVSVLCSVSAVSGARPRPAAQAAAPTNPGHVVGEVSTISGGTMSVKTDAGVVYAVTVPDGVKLVRVAPGDKDLSKAQPIAVGDVGVGDRVLVRLAAGTASPFTAVSVIDIPHAAIVAKQRAEQMEWQTHGVGGLVKSVDTASGVIVITSGAAAKEVTLKTTPTTSLRRYAPDSVDYAHATAAPITAIHAGDQLRALLDGSGTEKTALEVVSGSFRNIAGKISGVNEKDGSITLRDLMTKKNVTVHILPTTQMKKLSDETAKQIAAMTKPAGGPPGAKAGGAPAGAAPTGAGGQGAWQRGGGAGMAAGNSSGHMWPGAHGAAGAVGAMNPQQMIREATVIQTHDLHKGEAIMLVATAGDNDVSAITLLAGVEPLLESSASAQNALMAGWSMGSGGDAASSSAQ